jgi:hypothetical protein
MSTAANTRQQDAYVGAGSPLKALSRRILSPVGCMKHETQGYRMVFAWQVAACTV